MAFSRVLCVMILVHNLDLVFTRNNCYPFGISSAALGYCPLFDYHNYYYRPVIITNAYRQTNSSGGTTISLQFDGSCYTKVIEVTPKDFPVISLESDEQNNALLKYPKCYGQQWEEEKGLDKYKDFQFDGRYGTYWKNKLMLGFNTDWLGCPQDLCLNGRIDTIYKFGSGIKQTHILRGRHVFEIDSDNYKLMATEPKLIDHSIDTNRWTDSMPDRYIDAMFSIEKEKIDYIIKGDTFWYSEEENKSNKTTSFYKKFSKGWPIADRFGSGFPLYSDSVIALMDFLYIFKGNEYWRGTFCHNCSLIDKKFIPLSDISGPKPVSNLHKKFPKKVNDILLNPQKKIHIFSDWNFYDFGVIDKSLEESLKNKMAYESHSVFKVFGCSDESYRKKGFNDLKDYLEKIKTFNKLATRRPPTTQLPTELRSYYIAFGVIVTIMIGITLVVCFALRQKKTESTLRMKNMDRIEAGVVPNKDIKVDKPLTSAEKTVLTTAVNKQESIRSMIDKICS